MSRRGLNTGHRHGVSSRVAVHIPKYGMRLSARIPLRPASCLVLILAATMLAAGCGGDGTTGNVPPRLAFQTPDQDLEGPVGLNVDVRLWADDPDDEAVAEVFLDRDGDPGTTGDRILLADDLKEQDGAVLQLSWDSTGAPEGEYHLLALIRDGHGETVVATCPARIAVWNTYPRNHDNIVLRDVHGDAIPPGSNEPYSPRRTCGACHDVDEIANGYHFQQGRTNAEGLVQAKSDFFADGRSWLLSDGMYGKW